MIKKKKVYIIFILCLLAGIFLPLKSSEACACGMLISEKLINAAGSSEELKATGEKGLVVYNGDGKEQMVTYFKFSGDNKNSAVVIPTPKKAEITQVKRSVFSILNELKEAALDIPMPTSIGSSSDEGAPDKKKVTVLEEKEVGSFEIVAVKTSSFDDLFSWSEENGYNVPKESKTAIDSYIEKEFVLNIIKLKREANEDDINPLKFEFETDKLFYPTMHFDKTNSSDADTGLEFYILTAGKLTDSSTIPGLRRIETYTGDFLKDQFTTDGDAKFSKLEFIDNTRASYSFYYLETNDYTKLPDISLAVTGADAVVSDKDIPYIAIGLIAGGIIIVFLIVFTIIRKKRAVREPDEPNREGEYF